MLFWRRGKELSDNSEVFSLTKKLRWKNYITLFVASTQKFKNSKITYISKNGVTFSIICSKWENEDERLFKVE